MSPAPVTDSLDLTTLARGYDEGTLTPAALIERVYARIEQAGDPNVWIHLQPKAALLEQARALGGKRDPSKPLWGVPFGVKDNLDVAGMPTTAACPGFAYVPTRSALAVQRLLDAGGLCLGKTNMDQFATGLVGTRSPYGACNNAFDPRYLSGGSSSGSAVAVAAGHVSFALGTDTAGSGRVPAALNNVVGLKPTRGLVPTDGVVPACRSLDCVSVFALGAADAACVRELMTAGRAERAPARPLGSPLRVGVPRAEQLEFFGDGGAQQCFAHALAAFEQLGALRVEIDWTPFARVGDLLYGGPWLAERVLAVGEFIRNNPQACLPVTRDIISAGERYSATDAFKAQYLLASLRDEIEPLWDAIDVLLLPTTPTIYTQADDQSDPRMYNDRLGIYTRFANFLGYPALALPAGFRNMPNGGPELPFGVTLVRPEGEDRALDELALRLERKLEVAPGRARIALPATNAVSAVPQRPDMIRVAVLGAHMRGLPLNHQLIEARASFVRATRTAPTYRLYSLPNTQPRKPGLERVSEHGAAIELELWDIPSAELGGFFAKVGAPLGLGNLVCEDGELVKGFLCEHYALQEAEDITRFGGFRAYLASQR